MGFIKDNKFGWFILVLFVVLIIWAMIFSFNRNNSLEEECNKIGFKEYFLQDRFFCIDEEGLYRRYNFDCNFFGTECSITEYNGGS